MNSIESVERLNKLVRRLNPEQFVTVDVDSLVHLLAAWKMLEKLPESVRREYSIAMAGKMALSNSLLAGNDVKIT
jgi:hypothetical protein